MTYYIVVLVTGLVLLAFNLGSAWVRCTKIVATYEGELARKLLRINGPSFGWLYIQIMMVLFGAWGIWGR